MSTVVWSLLATVSYAMGLAATVTATALVRDGEWRAAVALAYGAVWALGVSWTFISRAIRP